MIRLFAPRSIRHFALALPLIAAFVAIARTGQCRPPTVDPTYGLPVPTLRPTPVMNVAAQWIWVARTVGAQTVEARGVITLSSAPKTAELYATGDDAFTAFVNGTRVSSSVSVEQGWKMVHRVAVGRLLHKGRNVVALQGTNDGGAAALLAELIVDGKPVLWTSDHWKVNESTAPPATWAAMAFDDSAWSAATPLAPVGQGPWSNQLGGWPGNESAWYLAHRVLRPVRQQIFGGDGKPGVPASYTDHSPVVVHGAAAGAAPTAVLFDFGQELAGRLEISGTPGAKVTVTTGETSEECTHDEPALDNRGPWTLTLGTGESSDDRAVTPYTAFRYARIVVAPGQGDVRLDAVDCDHKYYPVAYRGSFDCSDPSLTAIWYAGAYTAHLCMQEEIWDAPKRDRGLWCGDLQVTGATINAVFADHFLMERSIAKLRAEAQGNHPDSEPAIAEVNTLPGYSAAWFCELADYYQASGNLAFLRGQHDRIIGLLEFQRTDFDDHNLFVNPRKNWNFVDWAPDFVIDGPQSRIATDLFVIGGVRRAVSLLRILGDTSSAARYDAWANTLTDAAQHSFVDTTTNTFGDRLQTNAMAVYSGVATPTEREAIYARILRADSPVWRAPNPQPGNLDCFPMTPYYGYFVLEDLGRLNQYQAGIDLIRRYWSPMMGRGTTTLWEKFDPALPNDFRAITDRMPYLSYCHGWSTGPTPFLTEFVLGVQATAPGAKSVRIAPFLGNLHWVEGDFPTPQGVIHVRAEKNARGGIVETVRLPAGIDAEIGISDSAGGAESATANGRPVVGIHRDGAVLFVHVNRAGTYRLVVGPKS